MSDRFLDIGGGLAVLPTEYVPQPDWTNADGLPRCRTMCNAAILDPENAQYQSSLGTQPRGLVCCVQQARTTAGTFCVPALVALKQKADAG